MMFDNFPFVSIIVPVYNGEKVISGCIESLLAQPYPKEKYEIIIMDNNSKDDKNDQLHKAKSQTDSLYGDGRSA